MIKLNTPGSRDGRVAVWQDGALIADWTGLRFRDVNTLKIDEIQLENGGQRSTQQNDKWYDNLVVATSYIGPMSTGSVTRPRPPVNVRAE
jgi:integrase